jgi:hypothetical protein
MSSFQYFGTPYLWEHIYEAAISEENPERRLHLLREAQQAVLQRAQALDEQETAPSFEEVTALEEAADFLRDMKLTTEADGAGKHIRPGDRDEYPR